MVVETLLPLLNALNGSLSGAVKVSSWWLCVCRVDRVQSMTRLWQRCRDGDVEKRTVG